MRKRLGMTVAMTAILLSGVTFSPPAEARTRTTSATFVGPAGKTRTYTGTRTCSGGVCTTQQTYTGRAGNTSTRNVTRQCAGGSCTTNAVTTGPKGGTLTRSTTTTP